MAKAEPQTNFTIEQKLDYAKLMVNENYINKKIMVISGAGPSAVTRWKRQYLAEIIWLGCALQLAEDPIIRDSFCGVKDYVDLTIM
jgi:transposase